MLIVRCDIHRDRRTAKVRHAFRYINEPKLLRHLIGGTYFTGYLGKCGGKVIWKGYEVTKSQEEPEAFGLELRGAGDAISVDLIDPVSGASRRDPRDSAGPTVT